MTLFQFNQYIFQVKLTTFFTQSQRNTTQFYSGLTIWVVDLRLIFLVSWTFVHNLFLICCQHRRLLGVTSCWQLIQKKTHTKPCTKGQLTRNKRLQSISIERSPLCYLSKGLWHKQQFGCWLLDRTWIRTDISAK